MTIQSDVALSEWCTLGVGGGARWFCRASSEQEVIDALTWAAARGAQVHVLGGGSNVVFADEGYEGLVLQIDVCGIEVRTERDTRVFSAGAGEPWDPFVARTVAADCTGLECLSGIPGQIGGTPVQNVGAYGQDVSGAITHVHVIDRETQRRTMFTNAECAFGYRTSRFKREDTNRFIVTRVDFALTVGAPPALAYADVIAYFEDACIASPSLSEVRDAVIRIRRRKGMVIEDGNPANRSVGSFFVNPIVSADQFRRTEATVAGPVPHYPLSDGSVKVPAAWLIERAGFTKGHRRGRVGVSPFQAQAIVNHDHARADEVLELACEIKRAVWNTFNIAIVPEPIFVGFRPSVELKLLLNPQPDQQIL
jgi:UDP-N-acetylmuramate dehydrogenase